VKVSTGEIFRWGVFIAILGFSALFFAQKIILHTADLGRFIQNGHQIMQGNTDVFNSNYYSYTMPQQPFINHHWGTGLIYFWVWTLFGFTGLSYFNISLYTASLAILFLLARRVSSTWVSSIVFLAALPLWSLRSEVRPESLSVFFLSIIIGICFLNRGKASRYVFCLPLIMLIWLNCHIFFIFGFGVIAAFTLNALLNSNKKGARNYFIVLGLCVIALFINPNGIKGALVLLTIFNNYGYTVIENQSIWFMKNRFGDWIYTYIEILVASLSLVFVGLLYNRIPLKKWLFPGLILLFFIALAFKFNRAIPLLGFMLIPLVSFLIQSILNNGSSKLRWVGPCVIILSILPIKTAFSSNAYTPLKRNFGVGLAPQSTNLALFLRANSIQGPIFNNYDIGGYLIFSIFPSQRIFVDNRPEAYTHDFFQKVYIPMQETEQTWSIINAQIGFNSIIFFRHDRTPWAQPFLIRRLKDPLWVPVYVDGYSIVLLKNSSENQDLIQRFKLPDNLFEVKKNR